MPSFFDSLPTFTEFDQVLDGARYVEAPSDAWVALTDVKGSTKAVEAGRYKDVNALGVASILAAQNAAGVTMPYVFGGDGASLVVPAEHRDRVAEALASLCGLAASQLGLTLRAAMVPVAELHRRGAKVEIASYQAGGSIRFAMFRGGGLALADFDGRTYRDDVLARSDTRKFDDCLRMVLDLDEREAAALEAHLAEQEAAGRLTYGVHRARSALMTCVVRDHQDNHVHFIDGADGGYTFAARAMKAKGR